MSAILEATAVIKAKDETKPAFESVEARIKALSASTKLLGKEMERVGKVSGSAEQSAKAFTSTTKAVDGLTRSMGNVEKTFGSISRAGKAVGEQLPGLQRNAAAAREAATGARVLREQLDHLTGAASKLSVIKEQLPAFAALRREFMETSKAAATLAREMGTLGIASAELAGAFDKSKAAAASAGAAYREQGSILTSLRAEVESVIGPMRSLAEAQERIKVQTEAANGALRGQAGAARAARRADSAAGGSSGGSHPRPGRKGALGAFAEDVLPFAGPGMLHDVGEAVHEGAHVEHERVRLRALGSTVTPEERAAMEKQALDLATEFPLVTQAQLMHQSRNAVSVVGTAEEAMEIARPMAQLRTIANARSPGSDNEEAFDQLIKGMEIKGVTQNPEVFKSYMNGIAKGLNAFGDTLEPKQYYDMMKYGRQATPMLSEDFILGAAPSVSQRMGGSSFGKGVSAFNSAVVGNRLSKKSIKAFMSLGMLGEDDVKRNKAGEAIEVKEGHHIKGWELAQRDPFAFMGKTMDAMDARGIKDPSAVSDKIGQLFGNQMAAQLALILAEQRPQVEKDMRIAHNAQGLDSAKDFINQDPLAAASSLVNELKTLAGVATAPVMHDAAGVISALAADLGALGRAVGTFAQEHPDAAKALSGGGIAAGSATGLYLTAKLFGGMLDFLKGKNGGGAELRVAAHELEAAAASLKSAAVRPGTTPTGGPSGTPGAPGAPLPEDGKPGGTSFDNGRALLAAAGLVGLAINAPGMEAAGDKEREGNASALNKLGNALGFGRLDQAREALFGKDGDATTALERWWQNRPSTADPKVIMRTPLEGELDRMRAEMTGESAPLPPERPGASSPMSMLPADATDRMREREDAIQDLGRQERESVWQFGQLNERTGVVAASFTTLDGQSGTTAQEITALGEAAATAAGILASLAAASGGGSGSGPGGGGSGVIQAAYHPGEGGLGTGSAPALTPLLRGARRGDSGGSNPYAGGDGGAVFVPPVGDHLTAGMRNNNLGNIGYFGQHMAGLIGPSNARDVDHSIGKFATQKDGIRAAAALALSKYHKGRHSTWDIIAAKGGWTPGALGPGASVNVARAMGLSNHNDVNLDDPERMVDFLHGLAVQEHGPAGQFYSKDRIRAALAHQVFAHKAASTSDAHLPPGGYWAKDSKGNPVPVGPDGAAIQGFTPPHRDTDLGRHIDDLRSGHRSEPEPVHHQLDQALEVRFVDLPQGMRAEHKMTKSTHTATPAGRGGSGRGTTGGIGKSRVVPGPSTGLTTA